MVRCFFIYQIKDLPKKLENIIICSDGYNWKEKQKIIDHYYRFIKQNRIYLKNHNIEHISDWLRYLKGNLQNSEELQKNFKKHTMLLDKSRNEDENYSKLIIAL